MEKRLHLLCQAGLLDQDIHDGMLHVVNQLETCWAIPVRNAQGEMAITHMANALMRSRRGEIIAPLDDALLGEIAASEAYDELLRIQEALLAPFAVTLHANEQGYLLANLFSLWQAGRY
ncbi:PRD domain-containing protein [Chimaeribacter californicus]|uniref:PRD domain-containing protein n=1 Tax=Chimaeribacter californicus TaxID=2060067 RepID=A0A2N5EBN8_9GAMM|nr:PRD domain-containing protein [Chimaeribacter californicus]PLR39572.1 PRD domain-containing protein [Chimaeribacter californicus]